MVVLQYFKPDKGIYWIIDCGYNNIRISVTTHHRNVEVIIEKIANTWHTIANIIYYKEDKNSFKKIKITIVKRGKQSVEAYYKIIHYIYNMADTLEIIRKTV